MLTLFPDHLTLCIDFQGSQQKRFNLKLVLELTTPLLCIILLNYCILHLKLHVYCFEVYKILFYCMFF